MKTPSLRPATSAALALAVTLLAAGCSDEEPVSHSAPIGINLKVKSSDVSAQTTISADKNITTESGNPWAKFVTDARTKLTHDPSDVDLAEVTLTLGATSTGVTALEEIFTGEVVIQFVMETSNNIVPVAKLMNPTGRGPVKMTVQFDYAALPPQDLAKFYAGSYKVVLAGPAAATFKGKGADADLQATFTFQAFE